MLLLVGVDSAESLAGGAHTSSLVKLSERRSIADIHIVDKDRVPDRLEPCLEYRRPRESIRH